MTNAQSLKFWSHVSPIATTTSCALWSGLCNAQGYGKFFYGGKYRLAHRVMYELKRGAIPDGMCVCHSCDTPSCVNPAHLWLGTNAENIADRDRKGRGRQPRGERNGQSKLSAAAVARIRSTPKQY